MQSAANIFWNLAAMANHRRAPHTGRPFPQQLHFLAELILTAGALVCFVFMVVILTGRGGALPLAYHQSLAWLLGMQM
ncbi:hypothetical protein IMZ48_09660 [Candidatus Bathyarchaeota archaeon]|nr:hypothetical protein [Candidatus Bathyarchaeota archaeon]